MPKRSKAPSPPSPKDCSKAPSPKDCLLLFLPEDLLLVVLSKLGHASAVTSVNIAPPSRQSDEGMVAWQNLRDHAREIARAEATCGALRRSCGAVWWTLLLQHPNLGYAVAAPSDALWTAATRASWKGVLGAAVAQPAELVCSAAVAAGVLPLRCRGLAAQFRGELGRDQAVSGR